MGMERKISDADIEAAAIAEYRELANHIVLVYEIEGYVGDHSHTVTLKTPVFARVTPYESDKAVRDNICRWTDQEFLDPYLDIEILSECPEIGDMRSTWMYGSSRAINGAVERTSFATVPADMLARYMVEGGPMQRPSHQVFEIVLPGFDGSTDETDDRVLWISALDADSVKTAIEGTGASLSGIVPNATGDDVDFHLPIAGPALKERIAKICEPREDFVASPGL